MKLVSAIMPTRGRPELAERALRCFEAQTYELKQIIILDDEDNPSFREPIWNSNRGAKYRHSYCHVRWPIALKRNKACASAEGSILMHWDDDDWSDPTRMADQVQRLEESGKQVTGYHSLLFYCAQPESFHKYYGSVNYGLGTSLAYTKAFWQDHKFPEQKNVGEDNDMIYAARNAKELISVDAEKRMVARIHSGNTSRKHIEGAQYRKVDRSEFPDAFFQ